MLPCVLLSLPGETSPGIFLSIGCTTRVISDMFAIDNVKISSLQETRQCFEVVRIESPNANSAAQENATVDDLSP